MFMGRLHDSPGDWGWGYSEISSEIANIETPQITTKTASVREETIQILFTDRYLNTFHHRDPLGVILPPFLEGVISMTCKHPRGILQTP
jgi:hypothetical protein